MDIHLQLLGPPVLSVDGNAVSMDTRKAMAILARVVIDGRQRRDALAEWLWPGSPPSRARAALRRTLSTLRAALPDGSLIETGDTVDVDRTVVRCDAVRSGAVDPAADPAPRIATFMEGFTLRDAPDFDRWVAAEADRQQRQLLDELGLAADRLAAKGELSAAIALAERRVGEAPLHEAGYRQLMALHAWAGDRGAVTEVYLACVRMLDDELGVAPLEETDALYRAILSGSAPPRPTTDPPPARSDPAPQRRSSSHPGASSDPGAHGAPFVGRAAEMARLRQAWDRVADGGQAVVITGPAGAGKTRLLHEMRTTLAGPRAVSVTCTRAEAPLPYAPLLTLLHKLRVTDLDLPAHLAQEVGRLLPALAPAAPPMTTPTARMRFVDALATVVIAAATVSGGPAMLVIDDLHDADSDTVAFVAYLARRLREHPVLLVLATADGALADGVADTVIALDARDPVAPSGSSVGSERLKDLGGLSRQVLLVAAVLGAPAGPDLLEAVSGRTEEEVIQAVEDLLTRGFLVETDVTPPGYMVSNDVVRTAVLGLTSAVRHRVVHGRIADALMRPPHTAPAAVLAHHLRQAGREKDAAAAHLDAGRLALDLYANQLAVEHLDAAIALGHPDVPSALLSLSEAQVRLGAYRNAEATLTRLRSRVADHAKRADATRRLGRLRLRQGDPVGAVAHLEQALDLAPTDAERGRVTTDLAVAHLRAGDLDSAERCASVAVELAPGGRDGAWARNVAGLVARHRGRGGEAQGHLADALARAGADLELRIAVLNNLALTHTDAGEADAALDTAREALGLAERLGDRHQQAALASNVADRLHAAGDTAAAEQMQSRAVALFVEVGQDREPFDPGKWQLVDW